MLAVPKSGLSAMENWGLVLYREMSLLYDPGRSAIVDKQVVAVFVSHELAHQVVYSKLNMSWIFLVLVGIDPEVSRLGGEIVSHNTTDARYVCKFTRESEKCNSMKACTNRDIWRQKFHDIAYCFTNYCFSAVYNWCDFMFLFQWFGNLVTPSWWDDAWLKEGFSTYLSYLGIDSAEPGWKMVKYSLVKSIKLIF